MNRTLTLGLAAAAWLIGSDVANSAGIYFDAGADVTAIQGAVQAFRTILAH